MIAASTLAAALSVMAHFGLIGPVWTQQVIQINPHVRQAMPARKYWLHKNTGGTTGTYGANWVGFSGLSTECDWWADDPSWFYYKWTSTIDSAFTIDMRCRLQFNPATAPTAPVRFHWRSIWTAWETSNEIANLEIFQSQLQMVSAPAPGTRLGPGWNNVMPLSFWLNMPFAFHYGTWEEQPDFHPYRQNPFA